jgi:hypothetical protein
MIGGSLLALATPMAHAQTSMQTVAPAEVEGDGRYLVTFALNQATLTGQDRQVITQAVENYRTSGEGQVTVTGYTDTSGPAAYNLDLSRQRAEMVANELIAEGIPANQVVAVGRGEEDLLVPTPDGVREPRNRRVEIVVPQRAPAPAPVAAAPVTPEPAPAEPEREEPRTSVLTIGPLYGHNFGENNDGGENDLVGG